MTVELNILKLKIYFSNQFLTLKSFQINVGRLLPLGNEIPYKTIIVQVEQHRIRIINMNHEKNLITYQSKIIYMGVFKIG